MKNYLPRLLAILFLMSLSQIGIHAQNPVYAPGELIVQLKKGINAEAWARTLQQRGGAFQSLKLSRQISRPTNICLLQFDEEQVADHTVLQAVSLEREVRLVQFNHSVTMRETIPDDPGFADQWQYLNDGINGAVAGADIDADLAWDLTTGGTTVTGDTIVVAALDDGVNMDHEDFQINRWRNHGEIPDNGIDDDGNGYVDDYDGWSIITDDDNIAGGSHGTPVAGIIGADGNNGIGVTGVSWHVKVMIIKNNFATDEAAVLEAYSYALEQRLRYNNSGGQDGAFVVATNASWGVNFGQPEDSPIWCSFYDTLGEAGILNCGATINGNTNVDEEGDLPTACPSDFMISVTNMNSADEKVTGAGYGLETIDLGAFGANAYTLAGNGGYGGFGGTSGATPHVAGAIGLLYSLPCPDLVGLTQDNPAAAAQLVRQAILDGVDPNESLEGITVTGGRLNVYNSLNLLMEDCGDCIPATSIRLTDIIDTTATLAWNTNDSLLSVDFRWRLASEEPWNTITNATSPYFFTNLTPCEEYEIQFQSYCANDTIAYNASYFLETDGCCDPPAGFDVFDFGENYASFNWSAVLAANSYTFRYREEGETDWIEEEVNGTVFVLQNLIACTRYEYGIRTNCDGEDSGFTPTQTIFTFGCGACLDEEYCVPDLSTEEEFIDQVLIEGILDNASGISNSGYQDFGEELGILEMEQGAVYDITLTPGFVDGGFQEAWAIWIDLNQNGQFTSQEMIFSEGTSNEPIISQLSIPVDAMLGNTRMRVLMRFQSAQIACPNSGFGEVEDYCIDIVPTTMCFSPSGFVVESADTSTVEISWNPVGLATDYIAEYQEEGSTEWVSVIDDEQNVELTDLEPCTDYTLRVKTICGEMESEDFSEFPFTTDCIDKVIDLSHNNAQWGIAPNPVQETINLTWKGELSVDNYQINIIDITGRSLKTLDWNPSAETRIAINLNDLPAGAYLINLSEGNHLWASKRFVKIR